MDQENKLAEYAKNWERVWMTCGRKETALFESNNLAYTEELITCNARKNLMVWIYCLLRNYKKITAIEDLEAQEREQLLGFVNEICAGKTDDPKRIKEIAMVFYTIEYFLNER